MTKITKAVFPVGGMGTRFLPATKSIPKELLPVLDKPLIQYAVEEAIEAGIETLIFITSASKHAISDHFDPMPDLREKFMRQNKMHLVEKLDTLPLEINRVFIPQGQPLGLGHAVLQAEPMIEEGEYFAVLLADDFIVGENSTIQQLMDVTNNKEVATISVEKVSEDRISSYGVIKPGDWSNNSCVVDSIVEKPPAIEAPSDYGVIGRYVLPYQIFDHLRETTKDKNNEIQLTDAIKGLVSENKLHAVSLSGKRFDCGSHSGFILANLHVSLQNDELKDAVLAHLKTLHC